MLNEGIFQFDKITIVPNMREELIEKSRAFQPIRLKMTTFYLSEVYWDGVSWDLRVMVHEKIVRRFELRMIEKLSVHNQLAEKYAAHNKFLKEQIGSAYKETFGRIEYSFEWGNVCSYMDIKTGECVILVEY